MRGETPQRESVTFSNAAKWGQRKQRTDLPTTKYQNEQWTIDLRRKHAALAAATVRRFWVSCRLSRWNVESVGEQRWKVVGLSLC
ncbi:hypothetical protein H5410_034747 [Solanum commersonii]|uniref:Uncharacterized protein n=1 Tax=Solanum commersonii TaxID=4109 RepID=A0A9J5YS94_SOLCO|nr:hypothetical protein H5410_034747 [Solanum commersonii]